MYCSMSSTDTWLVVHSGNVNLKRSNVGHQEGQSAPVDHLRGSDITGVQVDHAQVYHHGDSSRNTGEKTVEPTFISMTLSKRICGAS